ncbi:MAG: energy-coupling factor transporter transmembrane component T [Arcanobacterium sp.]|nr:energy-coupling factor transporter transmembrane component T [Arcanobacterium sp.]
MTITCQSDNQLHQGANFKISSDDVLAAGSNQTRPDPRTVLLVMFVLNALVMSHSGMVIMLGVAAVTLGALLSARAYSWAGGFCAIQAMWLVFIFVLPKIWPCGFTAFLVVLSYWMFKLCAVGGLAGYALKVIVAGELVAGLRSLRIPVAVTVPVVVLLRFVPMVVREYRAVREAMALRGLQLGWRALLHPLRYLELVLVPLLASCARIADEMTAAGMVRGLGSKIRPSTLKQLRFNWLDLLWLLILAGLCVLTLFAGGLPIISGGFR